jgi:hypothetical protein
MIFLIDADSVGSQTKLAKSAFWPDAFVKLPDVLQCASEVRSYRGGVPIDHNILCFSLVAPGIGKCNESGLFQEGDDFQCASDGLFWSLQDLNETDLEDVGVQWRV